MNRVVDAIDAGRCSLAISGSLLKDPDVMLALTRRGSLTPMALSGPPVAPVVTISDVGVARAAQPGGILVLIEPQSEDGAGLGKLAKILERAGLTPTVLVVSRAFNPFQFASLLPGVPVAHIKGRGKSFLGKLPIPTGETATAPVEPPPRVASARKAAGDTGAPRFEFVGREEELPALTEVLQAPGPVVVSGPLGSGRTWLVEHAIEASGLTRVPDLILGRGVGFDALAARLAELLVDAGDERLAKALSSGHTPRQIVELAVTCLAEAESLADKVMVVHELQTTMGRSGDFFRKSRVELLVRALLTQAMPLRLVFISTAQPRFFREGQDAPLRRIEVGGLKGRFLHDLFQSYKAPEFPREHFGPLAERIHGHPMAARTFAVELRLRDDGLKLLDNHRFLAMKSFDDTQPLRRHLQRRVDKLSDKARAALAMIAHFRSPVTGQMLADMGLGRRDRLHLLAHGVLDMVGTQNDRRYHVHPLIRSALRSRETSDFDILVRVGDLYSRMGRDTTGIERVAWAQEANRAYAAGRRFRSLINLRYPDHDEILETCYGLIRSKNPRPDLAEQRLSEILRLDPSNTDAWLLLGELRQRQGADKDVIQGLYDEAITMAATPELFHQLVNWHLSRRSSGQAVSALEAAVEIMPSESRLRTRLAAILLKVGRRPEALEGLRQAMEIDPMLPDAYGLLGQAKRQEGREALGEAEDLLREAVRLAPGDPIQTTRLVYLLLEVGRGDADRREAAFDEARELLNQVIQGADPSAEAFVLLAQLLRIQGTDLERCEWLLDKARKVMGRKVRSSRLQIERALLDLARGHDQRAEKSIRGLLKREPTNDEGFAALAKVLEARAELIPAHAAYQDAIKRVPANSLYRNEYEQQLVRLQGLIEAQAAGLLAPTASEAPAAPHPEHYESRVIRRPKATDEAEAPADEAAAPVSDEPPVDPATEVEQPADVEAAFTEE